MKLNDLVSKNQNYKILQKTFNRQFLKVETWEDLFHDFLINNCDNSYEDLGQVIAQIKTLRKKNRKIMEDSNHNLTLDLAVNSLESLFDEVKMDNCNFDLISYIKSLNCKQLQFYTKELLIQYLISKKDLKQTAASCNLSVSTFRYKVQKGLTLVFMYLFKVKVNINQFKIMSIQKVKPGFEKLATLIATLEGGYTFVASEFMPLYAEATGDVDSKFEYKASVVKRLINNAKEVIYLSEQPASELVNEVTEQLIELTNDNLDVVELESHKPEADSDYVLKNSKDRKRRK